MENAKYYTPSEDEFITRLPFEMLLQNGKWIEGNSVLTTLRVDTENFRVKCLDKNDIQDLGFKLISEEIKEYSHVCVFRNSFVEIFVQLNEKYFPRLLNIKSLPGCYVGNFSIEIKNKTELKKLMKQLRILKNATT